MRLRHFQFGNIHGVAQGVFVIVQMGLMGPLQRLEVLRRNGAGGIGRAAQVAHHLQHLRVVGHARCIAAAEAAGAPGHVPGGFFGQRAANPGQGRRVHRLEKRR